MVGIRSFFALAALATAAGAAEDIVYVMDLTIFTELVSWAFRMLRGRGREKKNKNLGNELRYPQRQIDEHGCQLAHPGSLRGVRGVLRRAVADVRQLPGRGRGPAVVRVHEEQQPGGGLAGHLLVRQLQLRRDRLRRPGQRRHRPRRVLRPGRGRGVRLLGARVICYGLHHGNARVRGSRALRREWARVCRQVGLKLPVPGFQGSFLLVHVVLTPPY